jgi:NADH dehydrogenase
VQERSAQGARIVIVGGGAGGLELVTRLGNRLGQRVQLSLVDRATTHIWKPLLHEVAAGSMDANAQQLEYAAQARWHHFQFQMGELLKVDCENHRIEVAELRDEDGVEILPRRWLDYDLLVLAIGSLTNFFGVPGAREHAFAIDTVGQAERFRRRMVAACVRAQTRAQQGKGAGEVHIVIIGGGATGVELSAELRGTAQALRAYGVHALDAERDIHITLIEAGPRILGPLPEALATHTADLLRDMNINILAAERVTEVTSDCVHTASGRALPADLVVWAGGIEIGKVLQDSGLPHNRLGQVTVGSDLRVAGQEHVFAMGDCAACEWIGHKGTVPPRAQAAHQQADFLFKALQRQLAGKPLGQFRYRDHGSLVSLGRYEVVGNLMGRAVGRAVRVEGFFARLLYISLYRQHLMALNGFTRMVLDWLVQWLRSKTRPRVKLH